MSQLFRFLFFTVFKIHFTKDSIYCKLVSFFGIQGTHNKLCQVFFWIKLIKVLIMLINKRSVFYANSSEGLVGLCVFVFGCFVTGS